MSADLTAFLTARYDEREKVARAAAARVRRWRKTTRPPWVRAREFATEVRQAALEAFEGRETPEDVLADVVAKRAIVELHRPVGSFLSEWDEGDPVPFESGEFGCTICALDDRQIEPEGWCDTLRALGSVFAAHPDYRAEWALNRVLPL